MPYWQLSQFSGWLVGTGSSQLVQWSAWNVKRLCLRLSFPKADPEMSILCASDLLMKGSLLQGKKSGFSYTHNCQSLAMGGGTSVDLLWGRQRELKAAPQKELNMQAGESSNSESPLSKVLWNKHRKGTHGDVGGALTLSATNFTEARIVKRINGTEERIH